MLSFTAPLGFCNGLKTLRLLDARMTDALAHGRKLISVGVPVRPSSTAPTEF